MKKYPPIQLGDKFFLLNTTYMNKPIMNENIPATIESITANEIIKCKIVSVLK